MAWTGLWLSLVFVFGLGGAEEARADGGFLPVPLWRFMKVSGGSDAADLGRPQFSCGDAWLSVRLKLVRHSNLSLEDGRRLSSLPDKCGASSQTLGSWLLLKFPYSGCPVESWVSNGTDFHRLKLRYFDHLLQDHVTAAASCQDPAARRRPAAAPLLRCTAADVTVKLPPGGSLQKVEALGKDGVVGTAISTKTAADGVLVQISREADTDSYLEITVVDAAGETSIMLSACLNGTAGTGRDHRLRAVQRSDVSEDEEDSDEEEEEEEGDALEAESDASEVDEDEDDSLEVDEEDAPDSEADEDDDDEEDASESETGEDDAVDKREEDAPEEDESDVDDTSDSEPEEDDASEAGDEDEGDSEGDEDEASDEDALDSETDEDEDDAEEGGEDDAADSEADEDDEDDGDGASAADGEPDSSGMAAAGPRSAAAAGAPDSAAIGEADSSDMEATTTPALRTTTAASAAASAATPGSEAVAN